MAMALAPLAMMLRRRRTGAALAGLFAAALFALPAQAQTYVVNGPFPITYTNLSGGTTVSGLSQYGQGISITIPFNFEYAGSTVNAVSVYMHGYVDFQNGGYSYSYNYGIPHPYTFMNNFIGPWWDEQNMTTGSAVKYKTDGTAPNRVFSIEWLNMCNSYTCSTQRFTYRMELHEKASRIRFVYGTGTASSSASVGMMWGTSKGIAVLSCTNASSGNCNSSSFPTNSYYEIAVPADLQITSISSDDVGYAGVSIPVSVSQLNAGASRH
jgi:hypothetical protein